MQPFMIKPPLAQAQMFQQRSISCYSCIVLYLHGCTSISRSSVVSTQQLRTKTPAQEFSSITSVTQFYHGVNHTPRRRPKLYQGRGGGGGTSAAAAISTRNVNRNRIFRTNEVILLLGAAEEVEIMEFIEKKFEVESNSKRTWELQVQKYIFFSVIVLGILKNLFFHVGSCQMADSESMRLFHSRVKD